ncbi:PREDICTED: FERM domain-containing protein 8 [Nicrophorus vespilloides]|uniref:FERM domain-containing protein 8 n=1 Tax=Nicrophorus vespilloides TaxID=110193 RepID=A0ABM1MYP0_NICVS|nr:PREDICTED: FERM domain-containing protein 8 [Nicrophorus vespilloides]
MMDGSVDKNDGYGITKNGTDYKQRSQKEFKMNSDKYNEYGSAQVVAVTRSNHDDYGHHQSEEAGLYSVSQRVPNVSTSYSNLCQQEGNYSSLTEWDRTTSTTTDAKDSTTSDALSDKQTSETNTNSGPSSVISGSTAAASNCESLQGPIIPTCVYLHSNIAIMLEVEDTPTATTDLLLQSIINSDELGLNKQLSSQIFSLWMCSPLLELQLKPTHKPYEIRRSWRSLVHQFSHDALERQQQDEPVVYFQRNVFFPQLLEEKIKDQKILELLYEEARYNVLEGRYPCEVGHYIMLGGIQARIDLGPYNPQVHSTHYFREEQCKYLPTHVRKSSTWTWLPISSKNSAEVRLLEQFKRIPASATNRKLMRKYLEFCWSLPFYGSAFFEGQVEQPVRGLTSLMIHQDIPVLVAINAKGVYVIDDVQCTVLVGLRYDELSWDFARPSKEDDPNCLPCLFLQFVVVENGARVSKILQVFSRQASLMDTLISGFIHQIKEKAADETDGGAPYMQQVNGEGENHQAYTANNAIYSTANLPTLSNKLSKLTLATFDDEGHCIGQMGSWSFSY